MTTGAGETYAQQEARLGREARTAVIHYGLFGLVALTLVIALGMWGCPQYNVYEQRLTGEAELRRAEQNRQIAVQVAAATEESAKHLAAAEITRAGGVAKANQIIGNSLRDNEDYLLYLWIHNLAEAEKNGAEVIYVPTEANLPILEATRRWKGPATPAPREK